MISSLDPSRIDGSFVAVRSPAVAAVELDGEAVLYHEDAGTVHVLNPIATIVWNCLDGSSDLDGLSVDLADAFSVEVVALRTDVLRIVREFGQQGLLEGVEPGSDDATTTSPALSNDNTGAPDD